MSKFLLFSLLLLLISCSDNPPPASPAREKAPASVHTAKPADAPGIIPERPHQPSKEETYQAGHLIAFANHAKTVLSSGFHFLPDALANNTRFYLATWQLPPRPKHPPRDNNALIPPAGLFTPQEMAHLEKAYKGMDSALNNLLAQYAKLEKYVLDPHIRDDGKRGKELGAQILASHKQFIAARKDWLETVNQKAGEAEKILLFDHPLQRQITSAQKILDQFSDITSLLSAGAADRNTLLAKKTTLEQLLDTGNRPPFRARPALERLYRKFLKDVRHYMSILDEITKYGDQPDYRRQLNFAQRDCQKSYNSFAAAANSEPQ